MTALLSVATIALLSACAKNNPPAAKSVLTVNPEPAMKPATPRSDDVLAADVESAVAKKMLLLDPSLRDPSSELAEIEQLVKPVDAALEARPDSAPLLYVKGLAHFAAGLPYRIVQNREGFIEQYEKAASYLDRIHGSSWEPEAAALHGYILTQIIAVKGGKTGEQLGPVIERLREISEHNLPNSPRVMLFRGLDLWGIPKEFGGDPASGLETLQNSLKAFSEEEASLQSGVSQVGRPTWGHAYALVWLGFVQMKLGLKVEAQVAFDQAMQVEPEYKLVKFRYMSFLQEAVKH